MDSGDRILGLLFNMEGNALTRNSLLRPKDGCHRLSVIAGELEAPFTGPQTQSSSSVANW